jgi:drug/metabolite transporter (DMT)-like permease
VGFTGAVLVVTRGRLAGHLLALPSTRGDLLVLASTLNWALYTVLGHGTIRRLGPTRATAGTMLLGWLLLAPLFLARAGWSEFARLSPPGWCALLFLGVAASALGYLLWYGALERVEASRVAALLYLEPLVTLSAAVALLGEPVGFTAVAGGLLVLGGVFADGLMGSSALSGLSRCWGGVASLPSAPRLGWPLTLFAARPSAKAQITSGRLR